MSATQTDIFGRTARHSYPADFEQAWDSYPKRNGGNPKTAAWRAYNARIRAGECPSEMLEGVKAYAAYVEHEGMEGTPYVMQAARFFGPDCWFLEPWEIQEKEPKTDEEWQAAAESLGLQARPGESWFQFKERVGKALRGES